jgi:hypothetical protein
MDGLISPVATRLDRRGSGGQGPPHPKPLEVAAGVNGKPAAYGCAKVTRIGNPGTAANDTVIAAAFDVAQVRAFGTSDASLIWIKRRGLAGSNLMKRLSDSREVLCNAGDRPTIKNAQK